MNPTMDLDAYDARFQVLQALYDDGVISKNIFETKVNENRVQLDPMSRTSLEERENALQNAKLYKSQSRTNPTNGQSSLTTNNNNKVPDYSNFFKRTEEEEKAMVKSFFESMTRTLGTVVTTVMVTEGNEEVVPREGSLQSGKNTPRLSWASIRKKKEKQENMLFHIFSDLRIHFGITNEELLNSLKEDNVIVTKGEGKSGAIMVISKDQKFIMKTISDGEFDFLGEFCPRYAQFMKDNPRTLLVRLYACFESNHRHVIIMNNVFTGKIGKNYSGSGILPEKLEIPKNYSESGISPENLENSLEISKNYSESGISLEILETSKNNSGSGISPGNLENPLETSKNNSGSGISPEKLEFPEIREKFDLKGSLAGRTVKPKDRHEGSTLKDLDFLEINRKIFVPELVYDGLLEQLIKDSSFLSCQGVMDYSLLVGIHYNPECQESDNCPVEVGLLGSEFTPNYFFGENPTTNRKEVYFMGIIDFLMEYTERKKMETFFKALTAEAEAISSINPVDYANRFNKFMVESVFVVYRV